METVGDYMTTNHQYCSVNDGLQVVSKRILENKFPEIIIVNNEIDKRPIGVISEVDITFECAKGVNPLQVKVTDCMRRVLITIVNSMDIEACLNALESHKLQRAPVVDEKGRYCGEIALNDIAPVFKD